MTDRALNDLMEFEHVVRVENGNVADRMPDGSQIKLWAPECIWEGFSDGHIEPGTGWELLNGFSGQYKYSGPIMHASEYIGGYMEEYILANDGYYVAVVCEDMDCTEDCEPNGVDSGSDCNGGHEPAGWAVAYRPL